MKKMSLTKVLKESGDSLYFSRELIFWSRALDEEFNPSIAKSFFDDGMSFIEHIPGQDGEIMPSPSKRDVFEARTLLKEKYGKYFAVLARRGHRIPRWTE